MKYMHTTGGREGELASPATQAAQLQGASAASAAAAAAATMAGVVAAPPINTDLLQQAVAAAQVGLWAVDLPTGAETWNRETLAIYGLAADAPAPSRSQWREHFLAPQDAERASRRAAEFVATRRPYELEYRIRRASDGQERWLYSRAVFSSEVGGQVLGVTLDITERKAAEAAARAATEMLHLCTEASGIGTWERDMRTGAARWNDTMFAICGLQPGQGTPSAAQVRAMYAPDELQKLDAAVERMFATGQPLQFEVRLRRPDGSIGYLLSCGRAETGPGGERLRAYGNSIDITAWRRDQADLAASRSRLQMASEVSGLGLWECHDDGSTWSDVATRRLYGQADNSAPPDRTRVLELAHPDDRPVLLAAFEAARNSGRTVSCEYRVRWPDGSVHWLHARGQALRDAQGQACGQIGVCFDVTERHEREAQHQALALARLAEAAKGEFMARFLSHVSHELRTPLNAVLGFAQLLELDTRDPLAPAQRDRVVHIQTAAWQLLGLLDDVLALAHRSLLAAELRPALWPLHTLLSPVRALGGGAAGVAGVAQARVPWQVWADPQQLPQVLDHIATQLQAERGPGGLPWHCQPLDDSWLLLALGTANAVPMGELAARADPAPGVALALCRLALEQMGAHLHCAKASGAGQARQVVVHKRRTAPA